MLELRKIKTRIRSVEKIRQVTRAMKMVATVKLRRAQTRLDQYRPYAQMVEGMARRVAASADPLAHPLLRKPGTDRKAFLIVTADRGLCGALNTNILREVRSLRADNPIFLVVGERGARYCQNTRTPVRKAFTDILDVLEAQHAKEIAEEIFTLWTAGEIGSLTAVYNRFVNAARHVVTYQKLLPLVSESGAAGGPRPEYIYESPAKGGNVLDQLLREHLSSQVFRILLDAYASEQGARMTAMDAATDNADEMIRSLTIQFNRARQAAITKEIAEIVGGAEALR